MNALVRPGREVRVCMGPGCRAWDAADVLAALAGAARRADAAGRVRVCAARCMNRCGGGVSVQSRRGDAVQKLRGAGEVEKMLPQEMEKELACI